MQNLILQKLRQNSKCDLWHFYLQTLLLNVGKIFGKSGATGATSDLIYESDPTRVVGLYDEDSDLIDYFTGEKIFLNISKDIEHTIPKSMIKAFQTVSLNHENLDFLFI